MAPEGDGDARGATVVYATHIFDGLDDWPTHLHYLNRHGATGWQGPMGELELYAQLRKEGHPSPMLKIATTWLRAEIAEFGVARSRARTARARASRRTRTRCRRTAAAASTRGGCCPTRPRCCLSLA